MSDTLHVILNGQTVTNIVIVDPADTSYIAATGAIDVSAVSPAPGIGWTTTDAGKTFTAPPTPPLPTPTAQQQAQVAVVTLAQALPGHITQAQADATTIAGITAGSPLTAAQVTALTNHANGWVTLLNGLQTLVAAQGIPA